MESSSTYRPPPPAADCQEHHVAAAIEDFETICWGCGLRLIVPSHASAYICGWCGAISNKTTSKKDNKYFWCRRLQDRCFVCLLIVFMLFLICGGLWAIYPVVFSINFSFGVFNCFIATILSVSTISMYCFSAFRSAGSPPIIPWGSYPAVGRGDLAKYTFCSFCSKPKSPRTHHCRSCGKCVLDMDHHCPFIGNCVGAANHRSFILFLISAVMSTIYISIISAYAATKIWPSLDFRSTHLSDLARKNFVFGTLKGVIFAFLRSAVFISPRGVVLVYLFIASVALQIGLSVLLWQQLYFIYEGKTYLSNLKSQSLEDGIGNEVEEKDLRNIIRFFDCPSSASRVLQSLWSTRKKHKK
ncbi:protein S-acyltransferase 11 [Daucus carota subsp. sativus]|uniref:protein S-acyltransferase 11 n=1 Tax=Daucus carota subsp. sativus TaxID=79200 RepID=UPI0007EF7ECF|nr:PREDICTED: protein S-acyltransferase 11 [Daucus carota subsp. sativus]